MDNDWHQEDSRVSLNKPVIIEDDVFIGVNSMVLKGVRIGAGSLIGAGSVVTKDIPPGVIAAGVPAKVIRVISHT
jgi:acetyltransferase-like isoleucine patch superfamily enzyme